MITNFRKYEGTNWTYRTRLREVIEHIQKILTTDGFLDINDKYSNMLLTMIPTNQITEKEFSHIITPDFNQNIKNLISNIEDIIRIMINTNKRGLWAELIIKYLLETKFNLKVDNATAKEDKNGVDLKTPNNTHQVKIINKYQDIDSIFIINSYIDIKKSDKYDYLWFFVKDYKQVVCFKYDWINVDKISYNQYEIQYNNIKKFDIESNIIEKFRIDAGAMLAGKGEKIINDIIKIGKLEQNI